MEGRKLLPLPRGEVERRRRRRELLVAEGREDEAVAQLKVD